MSIPLRFLSNTTTSDNSTQANQQTGWQQNRYTGAQQAAQGGVLSGLMNFLGGGQISPSFGMPQVVYDAFSRNFDSKVAPQIAANLGAGSMAGASQKTQGLEDLSAVAAQNAMSNFLGASNQAGQFAFTPVGQDNETKALQTTQRDINQNTVGFNTGGVLTSGSSASGGGTFPGSQPTYQWP